MSDKRTEEETVQPPEPEAPEDDDDTIRWDGSEAEMVADEDAEAYEETKTAVKISYQLTDEEVCRAFLHTSLNRKRRLFLGGLAALAFVLSVVSFVYYGLQAPSDSLVFGVLFAAAGAAVLVLPWLSVRRHARESNDHGEYTVKLYPDLIEAEHSGNMLEIPLDGTSVCEFYKGLVLLQFDREYIGGSLLILPLRSVEPSVLADVEAILRSGTHVARR
ncbi:MULTISPECIES: hypothetical protein [Caproicibacterium]|uniref:YcxB family protein n=1 Tax=Caproicibacterium argilliputei TaxID=3030016 RepID=A0AA97D8Q1_9FIRM|nr:hypothetical protein [Caproicibacterium argilliputei]WOC32291.1 hypothetical protein PXC00_00045 [Caproicibacterium argilliputei]